jgi:nucleoside 2-deoxyribosyltransferase
MIDPQTPTTERLIYLAGPYTGNPMGTTEEFVSVAVLIGRKLREAGWSVALPHCNSFPIDGWDLQRYLAEDFRIIRGCDALALLPNWQYSAGTRLEIEFASRRGIPIYDYTALLPRKEV